MNGMHWMHWIQLIECNEYNAINRMQWMNPTDGIKFLENDALITMQRIWDTEHNACIEHNEWSTMHWCNTLNLMH